MKILVIGGGQAALSVAAKYRANGGEGAFSILCDEPVYPYQRPPLSKAYLAGEMSAERLYLRPPEWYQDNQIQLELNSPVETIDRRSKRIKLKDGETLDYDKLVLCTGSRPRQLPGNLVQGATGIYSVRTLADIDAMRDEFVAGRRLLVVGGGYIGLEAAAIATKLGVKATIIEATERILGRVASPATADFIRALHQTNGVTFREGVGLSSFQINDGQVVGASLDDGSDLVADFVIAGIGALPNIHLAENAELACKGGIHVDAFCRTSDPDIYAAGDCTSFDWNGQTIRLESVGNAMDQGEIVAANLAGIETRYEPKPWFWSDQFDMTLQIAGLNHGYTDAVLRPGTKDGTQSVWYYRDSKLLAVDAMGDARAYMVGKRLIDNGKDLPKEVAANPAENLKDWI